MKRILAFILTLCLMATLAPFSFTANAATATATMSSANAERGNTVVLSVTLANAPSTSIMGFELSLPQGFTLLESANTAWTVSGYNADIIESNAQGVWFNLTELNVNGKVLNLEIKVGNDANIGANTIGFKFYVDDTSSRDANVAEVAGVITVNSSTTYSDYTYTVTDGKAEITAVSKSISGNVTIPSTLGGYPVTSIGRQAFLGCSQMTNVTIPNSVTSIGFCAFSSCYGLLSVNIPDSVTSIGAYSFEYCKKLESVTIGKGLATIGSCAFIGCEKLTSVTIGSGVTSISGGAFQNCTSLKSITIPENVTMIGANAFSGCTSLANAYFANAEIWKADTTVLSGLSSSSTAAKYLTQTYATVAWNWTEPEETPEETPEYMFVYKVTGGKAEITGVSSSLSGDVVIPKKLGGYPVTSIARYAFRDCTSLTSVVIPDSVTSIGDDAFRDCTGLTSIDIPNSVTSIGARTFSGCTGLTSITIPDSVTSIGLGAFYGCTGLTSITVDENNPTYHVSGNCLIETQTKTLIKGFNDSVIPNDGSVTQIGYCAFRDCTSLTSITIPASVTSIGARTFSGCTSLTSVVIPDSVTVIDMSAFSGCTSLTSVVIPDSVTYIGLDAFSGCTSLTSVVIPDSVTYIDAFSGCTSLTSITIPDSVTQIGYYAFLGCTSLTSITIPDSVTYIAGETFKDTAYYNDESNWENGVLYIGNHLIEAKDTLNGAYEIKAGTKTIANDAFDGCTSLTSITIPDGVTSIGDGAFYGCTSLTSVHISSIESWLKIDFAINPLYYAKKLYLNGELVTEVIVPDSITEIKPRVFDGCTSLTSITIPDSVTSIGEDAFYGCDNLEKVYFENTEGWKTVYYYGLEKTMSTTELADPKKAAELLKDTYSYYEWTRVILGDVNGDCSVDANDAIYLLYNIFFDEQKYPINQPCDFDGDGGVTANDAIYLLYHIFFDDKAYPLN